MMTVGNAGAGQLGGVAALGGYRPQRTPRSCFSGLTISSSANVRIPRKVLTTYSSVYFLTPNSAQQIPVPSRPRDLNWEL